MLGGGDDDGDGVYSILAHRGHELRLAGSAITNPGFGLWTKRVQPGPSYVGYLFALVWQKAA